VVDTCKIKVAKATLNKDLMVFIMRARKEAVWDIEHSLRDSGWIKNTLSLLGKLT
jgi:hypothetical protein